MFKSVFRAVFGDPNQKEIKKFSPLIEDINALEAEMKAKSDEEIRQMMAEFREQLREDTSELRQATAELRQQVLDTAGKERQRLQIELERSEKELLKLEAELLEEIQDRVFAAVREASRRTIGPFILCRCG